MNSRSRIFARLGKSPAIPCNSIAEQNKAIPLKGELNLFLEKAKGVGAAVATAQNLNELRSLIADTIVANKTRSVVITAEDLISDLGVAEIAGEQGVACDICSSSGEEYRKQVFKADIGISACTHAIAESGSVVICHNQYNRRLMSLAPAHHLCILKEEQILANRFSLAAILNEQKHQEKFSAITIITGVSRSADIAQHTILGMHGPRKISIFVLLAN